MKKTFLVQYSQLQFAIGAWGGVDITTLDHLSLLQNKIKLEP